MALLVPFLDVLSHHLIAQNSAVPIKRRGTSASAR
jgi:hypothetical protein